MWYYLIRIGHIKKQTFYQNEPNEWIDPALKNKTLLCEKAQLREILNKVLEQSISRNIYFLGSRNSHYLSCVLQTKIKL